MPDAFAVWAIFHSNQWSTAGPSKVVVCFVRSVREVHVKDPLLLIGKSSLCGSRRFPLKTYVPMIICLMSNRRWYEDQCAQEVSLNKTNFPFQLSVAFPIPTAKSHHIPYMPLYLHGVVKQNNLSFAFAYAYSVYGILASSGTQVRRTKIDPCKVWFAYINDNVTEWDVGWWMFHLEWNTLSAHCHHLVRWFSLCEPVFTPCLSALILAWLAHFQLSNSPSNHQLLARTRVGNRPCQIS